MVRGKERETNPDPVKGVGAGPGPLLLLGNYGEARRGQGDKRPSLWGLLSQRDVQAIWSPKGQEQASPWAMLSSAPSFLTFVPPTTLLGNDGKHIRARTALQPYWGIDDPVPKVCADS